MAQTTTISDNNILETAGMIHIRMSQNGREIKLKKGKEFLVLFPKQSQQQVQMNTFYGTKSDNTITWE